MITLQIDCPFSIGDWVYVNHREYEYTELECPFCHGKSEVDTGIMLKSTYRAYKNPKKFDADYEDAMFTPWIIKCETCNGTGKVSKLTGTHCIHMRAQVRGVSKAYADWTRCSFELKFADGTCQTIEGSSIVTEEDYKALEEGCAE